MAACTIRCRRWPASWSLQPRSLSTTMHADGLMNSIMRRMGPGNCPVVAIAANRASLARESRGAAEKVGVSMPPCLQQSAIVSVSQKTHSFGTVVRCSRGKGDFPHYIDLGVPLIVLALLAVKAAREPRIRGGAHQGKAKEVRRQPR
jgi:hypothetical protein